MLFIFLIIYVFCCSVDRICCIIVEMTIIMLIANRPLKQLQTSPATKIKHKHAWAKNRIDTEEKWLTLEMKNLHVNVNNIRYMVRFHRAL